MYNHAQTVNAAAGLDAYPHNNRKTQNVVYVNARKRLLLDHLLFFVKRIVEYFFGIYAGAVMGWLLGWHAGNVYVEHFEPVYCSSLAELNGIIQWSLKRPYEFAGIGKLIGALAGALPIVVISRRLLTKRIASMYENGVTNPKDIGRAVGNSVQQVERILDRIPKVGKVRPHG